ncbi:glycosyltransferase family 2 protein [Methanococcus maripaludis]|uniref:Glycosyltransferase family 2 protein n=3 Tax=Methanococcus maripaludis TaxID=39152 RepID=A0A8T3W672_METMI|nr:glycosyltransferase family 2 protein [Methanococcus maripaludis]AEK20117.1 glycosyl transferase family protein [Methanococcus maripaludis X1]MBG0768693.1 glycosyltransferase family 2 protein [Methanococcus maripaludis]BAP63281.1 glycosyl transferase [Methanococcus maripaludis OS7]
MNPQVSIIILNWNGWEDTIECLESLYRINYLNYNVVLIDNGSKDESIEKIQEYCSGKIEVNSKFFKYSKDNKPIEVFEISEKDARNNEFSKKEIFLKSKNDKKLLLIKNEDNYGFAGGNNVGMKFAIECLNSDYVLLLNNDTVVDENFLTEMVKVGESDEKIGVVGSKIYYYDYEGRDDVIWYAGGIDQFNKNFLILNAYGKNKVDDNFRYNSQINLKSVVGCSILLKKSVLLDIGFFDEYYFLYHEEMDLCIRAKKNWMLIYSPKSILWHKVAKSSGGVLSPVRIYYLTRNGLYFSKKHNSKMYYCIYLSYLLSLGLLIRIWQWVIINKKPKLLKYYFKGIYDALVV